MKTITRRHFIRTAGKGAAAAFALSYLPQHLVAQSARFNDIPIGFQTYSVRKMLEKDFPGTLKIMAGMGYKITEMCSPAGYTDAGFGALVKLKPSEIKKIINDAGLTCPSCHFGFGELSEDKIDERIEFAKGMELSHMICSTFSLPKNATLNDYTVAADKLYKAAEKIKKAGMQAGFHNHATEFEKLDNTLIYDVLMNRFDPELVKMQFQTEVINKGYKAAAYFNKYPGRFISTHMSDWTAGKKQAPIGQGVIDWKEFFAAAKTGGVKTFYVEMDFNTFADSAKYIQAL